MLSATMLPDAALEKLKEAQAHRRLVAFHQWDDDPSIFCVGFVKQINEDSVLFEEVGVCGEPDEDQLVAMAEIVWLDFETNYLKGLEILHPIYENLIGGKPTAGIKATNTRAITQALKAAADQGEAITFRVDKESVDAIVNAVEGDYFSYTKIEDGGHPNGVCWVRIDVVKEVRRKTDRQIADLYLYNLHRSPK